MSDDPRSDPAPAPDPPERAAPSAWAYRGSIAALVLGSFLALFLVLRPPESASRAEPVRPAATPEATLEPTPTPEPQPAAQTSTPVPATPVAVTPVPTPVPTPGPDPSPTPEPPSAPIDYTIVAGDTLSDIAESFGVTLDAILELNPDLDPDTLQIGQIILVPRQ